MAKLREREPEPQPPCCTGLEVYELLAADTREVFDERWARACSHTRDQYHSRDWMRPAWADRSGS